MSREKKTPLVGSIKSKHSVSRKCQSSTDHPVKKARLNKLCLDQLPTEILDSILDYLQQPDLLSLALVSRALQQVAYKRLYEKISLMSQIYFKKQRIPLANWQYYTTVRYQNRKKFLNTVTANKEIAVLIKSLTIPSIHEYDKYSEEFSEEFTSDEESDEDDWNEERCDLSSYLTTLLPNIHLTAFHCMQTITIPAKLIETVQKMTICLDEENIFPPNLVELKITYGILEYKLFDLDELALEMIEQNGYHKLRKLAFDTPNYDECLSGMSRYEIPASGRPFWAKFFESFQEQKIKLDLTSLGINGEFWDDNEDNSAYTIHRAVRLRKLQALDLKYSHYVPSARKDTHKDGSHMFLAAIARNSPSLQTLSITHTRMCTRREMNALARILRAIIPNQLKRLQIKFEDQFTEEIEFIQRVILTHQTNLVRLKFTFNPCALDSTIWKSFIGVPFLRELEKVTIRDIISRQRFSPSILDYDKCKPFLNGDFLKKITSHKRAILRFLNSDLIYKGAAQNLPFLAEYWVAGLCINMKQRSIVLNGKQISLGIKKNTLT